MVCETRTEGRHLKSHSVCGITRGILHERRVFFLNTTEDNFVGAL